MKWNEILNLVDSMERLDSYNVIEKNESVKDIIISSSKISSSKIATLQSTVGELWEVKEEKIYYIDDNNKLDYLVNVRINNRVGDIVSLAEVAGVCYLGPDELNYLKENRDEFNRFIRVHRVDERDKKILKQLEELVNDTRESY